MRRSLSQAGPSAPRRNAAAAAVSAARQVAPPAVTCIHGEPGSVAAIVARPAPARRTASPPGTATADVPAPGDIASGRDEAVSREQRERVVDGGRPGDAIEVELDPGGHEHEPSEQADVVPASLCRIDEAARRARGVERSADRTRKERRDADHRAGGSVDLVQLAALVGAAEDVVALAEETDDRL